MNVTEKRAHMKSTQHIFCLSNALKFGLVEKITSIYLFFLANYAKQLNGHNLSIYDKISAYYSL